MTASQTVSIGALSLAGLFTAPPSGNAVVIFAHGSGSSRLSPRNQYVAEVMHTAGLGTLLMDLLTDKESDDRSKVFDIPLLAQRLQMATTWLRQQPALRAAAVGYFGASTGAAAALVAAAEAGNDIQAVVSRGGRPDLAAALLPKVRAPTLLIVGAADNQVLTLNEQAFARLKCEKTLEIVPGATHLFEEPGKLEAVAVLAREWFEKHLLH